jgi:beta-lactamase class A
VAVGQSGSGTSARHSARKPGNRRPAVAAAAAAVAVLLAALLLTRFLVGGGQKPGPGAGAGAGQVAAAAGDSRSPSSTASPGTTASSRSASSPSPPSPSAHRDPFGGQAQSYLSGRAGTVLAAVYDLRTGQTWTLGQGSPEAEASIVKVDILETLLAQHHAAGTALSAQDMSLAVAMIEDSDNTAATALWDAAGGARGIRTYNSAVGLADTTPSRCVDCPGFPWPGWGLSTTTPADQLALLREIAQPNGQLSDSERAYALGLMENVTQSQRWGVSGGVPSGVTVALKNGWLPLTSAADDWQINSIGWISGDGRSYLAAVLSTGNPSEQYGIDTINALAGIIWRRMS